MILVVMIIVNHYFNLFNIKKLKILFYIGYIINYSYYLQNISIMHSSVSTACYVYRYNPVKNPVAKSKKLIAKTNKSDEFIIIDKPKIDDDWEQVDCQEATYFTEPNISSNNSITNYFSSRFAFVAYFSQ